MFNIKGTKVGVIGYILPELKTMSKAEDVGVLPEIGAIKYAFIYRRESLNYAQDQDFIFLLVKSIDSYTKSIDID